MYVYLFNSLYVTTNNSVVNNKNINKYHDFEVFSERILHTIFIMKKSYKIALTFKIDVDEFEDCLPLFFYCFTLTFANDNN